jgi:UDP-N-acetyl-D-galactosamine dehydrogenase
MNLSENTSIAVIGLGYVGLPLAVEFGKKFRTLGFDINKRRVAELRDGIESTLEVDAAELRDATLLSYSTQLDDLRQANVYIVTVPTPIDEHKQPDLTPLIRASETLGQVIKKGDVAIFESTVYPGATEECCVPVIERPVRAALQRRILRRLQLAYHQSRELGATGIRRFGKAEHILFDLKDVLEKEESDSRL